MSESASHPRLFRSESVGQSLSFYLPFTLLSKVLGMVRGVALAWLMPRADYGLVNIALLVVNLLYPLSSLGLNDAVQRYVPQHETRATLRRFVGLAVPLVLGVGAVLSAVGLLLARPLGELLFEALRMENSHPGEWTAGLTRVAVLTAFALVAFFLILAILKGLRMYRAISAMELASNALFAVLAVGACLAGLHRPAIVVACYLAAVVIGIGLAGPFIPGAIRRGKPQLPESAADAHASAWPAFRRRDVAGQMMRFSLWASLAAVTWQVLLGYPLWHLHKMAGPATAAVYAAVQQLCQGILIVANSVMIVVQASVTKSWEAAGPPEADRHLQLGHKVTGLGLLAGGIGVTWLAPLIVRILPQEYAQGVRLFPLLILYFLLAGHLLFIGIHFHLIERTRHLFVPWVAGVAGHLLFSAWLVQPGAGSEAASRAAWAGIGGRSAALAMAMALTIFERRPVDRGSWLLILAAYVVAVPGTWTSPVLLALLLILAAGTPAVFTPEQKRVVVDRCRRVLQRMRAGG